MNVGIVIALALAASNPDDRFDLDCVGTHRATTMGTTNTYPIRLHIRLNLETNEYCSEGTFIAAYHCQKALPLYSVDDERIVLSQQSAPDVTSILVIDRRQGTLISDVKSVSGWQYGTANCTKAPFTNFPLMVRKF